MFTERFLPSKHDFLLSVIPKNRIFDYSWWVRQQIYSAKGLPYYVMGNDAATEIEENEAQEADDFESEEENFEVVDQQEKGEQNIFDILISGLL